MRFRQIGGAIGTSAGCSQYLTAVVAVLLIWYAARFSGGCFSFHEIDVTALFRRNIADLHTPDLFPLGDKKFFWHSIRSNFHLRSYETLAAD
jgi:hypothetical protein